MFAKVCVPFDTPTVLYLNHYRATSDGWSSVNVCDECMEDFKRILLPFVGNCTSDPSCRCNVCLRQPPSLKNLALYSFQSHIQLVGLHSD
jgi:predicted amidophosphoribosyltransferase